MFISSSVVYIYSIKCCDRKVLFSHFFSGYVSFFLILVFPFNRSPGLLVVDFLANSLWLMLIYTTYCCHFLAYFLDSSSFYNLDESLRSFFYFIYIFLSRVFLLFTILALLHSFSSSVIVKNLSSTARIDDVLFAVPVSGP